MLDLLVINPRSEEIYGGLGPDLVACEPPLWCRLIAAYIRDRGFNVKIIDAEALRWTPEQVSSYVRENPTRLICIAAYGHQPSASTQQMVGARAVALTIKRQVEFGPPIIMVGGHVSALPKRTMEEEPIDYACVGEGPVTILGLLTDQDTDDIPGLVWRDACQGEQIYVNPSAPLIEMKHLHGNAWDLLPMDKYRAHNWQCLDGSSRQPYASIHTSLNCPYQCSFCCISAPFGNNVYRMRDTTEVVNEMAMLYERYGVRTFKIVDEMFVLNERHYTAIAKQLIATGMGKDINIWAYARVDTVKPATLDLLFQAGFRWLALGIESGSKHVRDGAQKALKNDDIRAVVKAIQSAGISVVGNFIVGLPDDTIDTMEQTYQLAVETNCEFMNIYSAMAYPGSALYTEASRTRPNDLPNTWGGYSQHNRWTTPLRNEMLSAMDILRFRDSFFNRYFSRLEYITMIKNKFGDAAVEEIQVMIGYTIERELLTA